MNSLTFNNMLNITDLSIGGSKIYVLFVQGSNTISRISIGIGQKLMLYKQVDLYFGDN